MQAPYQASVIFVIFYGLIVGTFETEVRDWLKMPKFENQHSFEPFAGACNYDHEERYLHDRSENYKIQHRLSENKIHGSTRRLLCG